MGRRERQLDPATGPIQSFAHDLRKLRDSAQRPSYRELARRAHYSVTALSEAAGGERLPSLAVTLAYVDACGGDTAEWQARWHSVNEDVTKAAEPGQMDRTESPYLGLTTFEPRDADRFHGREEIVAELADRIEATPFLAVFGASGSGKSSVLRAGLLPRLTNRTDLDWVTILFTPGSQPFAELAIRLATPLGICAGSVRADLTADHTAIGLLLHQILLSRSGPARIVIVVDQFEEIFTLCGDEQQRAGFIRCLVAAAERARVVIGVRADFFARCAQYPELVAALHDRQVLIGPMDAADLRAVVREPAMKAGARVEATLVDAIVTDAHGEPGALPLVSHALFETWNRRTGDTMTLATYRRVGGVQGAIARTAERIYEELDPHGQERAKDIFLRLTALGQGTEDTRRRVARDELLGSAHSAAAGAVLAKLAAARLITMSTDTVEVAHEALIRSWPRLRAWLADDREQLVNHRRLTDSAIEWDQDGRDEGMLYRGLRLLAWEGQDLSRLNDLERGFLVASRHRAEVDRLAARRRVRRLLIGLAFIMVVLSVLATIALVQAAEARAERTLARSRQLVASARAQLQLDPELALLLAKHAYATAATPDTEAVLRQATAESRIREVVSGHANTIHGVSFSPDQLHMATSGSDGTVRVWRRGPLRDPVVLPGHNGDVWTPVFSPDGRLIAASGIDGLVTIWDWQTSTTPKVLRGHEGKVWCVTFSPDGRHVASVGDDGTIRIWPVAGGEPVVLRGHDGRTLGVTFSPDSSLLASSGGDGTIRIWTVATGEQRTVMRGHQNSVEAIAFSPDGLRIASASTDQTVRLWDLNGGSTVLGSHDGTAEGVAYSHDGRRIVSTGNDGAVRIWNAMGGGRPLVLRGHRGTTIAAAFSPDARQVASVGEDGTARLWDATEVGAPIMRTVHNGKAWEAVVDPAGQHVASGGSDKTVRIWPLFGGEPVVLQGHERTVTGVSYSPDGTRVASVSSDATARIWSVVGGPPVVLRHTTALWNAVFSPDGKRIVTSGYDGTVWLWPLSGGEPVVLQSNQGNIRWVDYSPDGRYIASAGYDGTVRVWDAATLGTPRVLTGHRGMVWSVAFSPDSEGLASTGGDGTVRIWPLNGGEPVVLSGHQGTVWSVTYSKDGKHIASTGNDGAVRIWPLSGGEPVVIQGFGTLVNVVTSTSTGSYVTAHDDGTVRVWNCEVCLPIEEVLRLASHRTTREMTGEERRILLNEP